MVTLDNFANKLCYLIALKYPQDEIKEWRLLGQEQNGTLLFSWTQLSPGQTAAQTKIGTYNLDDNLNPIHTFPTTVNCIQASVDMNQNYLAYTTKSSDIYHVYLINLNESNKIYDLKIESENQMMIQFLYQKQSILTEDSSTKFLILIHKTKIVQYKIISENLEDDQCFSEEGLTGAFVWAQWEPINQILYYIHNRKPRKGLIEGEDEPQFNSTEKTTPTLSALQFHDDLPHESVLNIPLNLPHIETLSSGCGIYEDDTVPLRLHDCSLDLVVLTDSKGFVCVCHHYLYQPIRSTKVLDDDDESLVHFAYSVTILHQSCVIHGVVPGLSWKKAKTIRPLFKFYGDDHIMVFIPEVCTQLLDVGKMHEPCCHITVEPILSNPESHELCLTSLLTNSKDLVVNLFTLDILDMEIADHILQETFKSETSLANRTSILHYLILHKNNVDLASELISWQTEDPLFPGFRNLLQEFLLANAYNSVQRNLPSDASHLINLLPITMQPFGGDLEVQIGSYQVCLSQDVLWNTSMTLLSPQQRIVPYRADIWVNLWEQLARLSKGKIRFRPSQVVEKLLVSLVCYQPEALSRSSTPMSPAASLSSSTLNDFLTMNNQSGRKGFEGLPFFEVENCTASKQEHIISVNLRELSMHLLKQNAENTISRFQWQSQTPIHVHAVATRYVTAQLEQSRFLCQILCKVAINDARQELNKGFVFIEQLQEESRYTLFTILERFYYAIESIAFPLPQGFTSFFTYLGYRTLSFEMFLQYVQRNVFELQIDVMKIIMADIDNSKMGVKRKLQLLALLPKSRAKRLLNQWQHPVSLMLRAREHSLNILSGVEGNATGLHSAQRNSKPFDGLAAFSSKDKVSPLDTFLDLLTAKASLADLDFVLLIEATEASMEEIL